MSITSNLYNFNNSRTKTVPIHINFFTKVLNGSNNYALNDFFTRSPDYHFKSDRECYYVFTCFYYELVEIMKNEYINFKHNFSINIPLCDYNSNIEKYSITFNFAVDLEGFKKEEYIPNCTSKTQELELYNKIYHFELILEERIRDEIIKFQSYFPEEGFLPYFK